MELWGSDTCTDCKLIRNWMQQTPIEFKYVDVAQTNFQGQIPMLTTDDSLKFFGSGQIKRYVQQKLTEMGF